MPIIDDLIRTREETLPLFDLPEADLDRVYAPGKWSVRYLLHHLADAESVLFDRIRRVLGEGRKVIWAFDQDGWARGAPYDALPMSLSRELYRSVRNGVIWYAHEHYEARGHLEFVHSETGVRTLKDEFDKVAWHNAHHLAQVLRALGRG